jgi:hypothetical protein
LPNPVVALRNGTIGWTLAGLELDHGRARRAPDVSADLSTALTLHRTCLSLTIVYTFQSIDFELLDVDLSMHFMSGLDG